MNYKNYFIIIIILIILISLYGLFLLTNKSLNLRDNNNDIIYSVIDENNKKVPNINLKGNNIDLINEDINNFVKEDLNNNSDISYKYNKYGNILSLLVRITIPSSSNAPIIKFKSYNIIINKSTLIDNDELFLQSNTDKTNVDAIIINHFIDFYNDSEVRNIIKYEDYISYRSNYFDINNDINYFIDNNKLYAYLNINNGMDYEEYEYLKNNDYRVEVGDFNG